MDSDPIESDSNIDDLLSSLNDDSYDQRHLDEDWTKRRDGGGDLRKDSRSFAFQGSMLNASFSQQQRNPSQQQSQSHPSPNFIHRVRGLAFNGSNQTPPAPYKPPNSSQLELRDHLFGSQSRHGRQSNSWNSSQKPTDSRAYALPPPLQPHMKQFPGVPTRYRESSIYEAPPTETSSPPPRSSPVPESYRGTQGTLNLAHAPPVVQGIPLLTLNSLPDRFRSIFPFPVFNAIQSRTFPAVFESSDNLVLSSPTGSGKTVILELAICRMVGTRPAGSYKIIYQAPTKALCAERKRDWEKKFSTLGLTVTELTGDTEFSQIGNVKNGDLIVTTPEKWDSMTRRWQDQRKLLDMVKLFLIDEVHILKETRGATLEVVVSRMKSIGIDVRFVALSATVPNLEDIATWLGRNSTSTDPAQLERFGEEFRPVRLQKVVYGYNAGTTNDFAFDKTLDKHLPEIIRKHSSRKPVLVFCMTRNMCISTAKSLANAHHPTLWPPPRGNFSFKDKDLQVTTAKGVAFHHAGVDISDRNLVERLFLEGGISVICCTSTLSVGVNLPAHLVILKNTVTWADNCTKEYVDLEVMQMLGRAGRPQFDDSGVAVIMTRKENKEKYERMVSGQEKLESCLHLNLIEHLNAEISLGTITTLETAKRWLKSTFLWVRLKQNPSHYRLPGQPAFCLTGADQKLEEILEKDLTALEKEKIITKGESKCYKNTEYGVSMARYYVKFETMKVILRLEPKAKTSAILMAMSQAAEYGEIRFRAGEKPVYKEINKSTSMKYPLKDIADPPHKIYLLMQADIGSIEFPTGESFSRHQSSFNQDKAQVNQHAQRIIRAIVDCKIHDKESITTRNALEIARCLTAKCWENSPAQIRQIEGLGIVAVRKLVNANVRSIAELRNLETFKIESILSRNPPFGMKVLKDVANIPIFRVYGDVISHSGDRVNPVKASLRVEIGCLNETTPARFHGRVLFAIFIAESEGHLIEFRRIAVAKLEGGKDVRFTVELMKPGQVVTCSLACEDVVGTTATHVITPEIDPSLFPPMIKEPTSEPEEAKPRIFEIDSEDEYEDKEFAAAVEDLDFSHIDSLTMQMSAINNIQQTAKNTAQNAATKSRDLATVNQEFEMEYTQGQSQTQADEDEYKPVQLPNGKWQCKHKCGDKKKCKHLCCHIGLDNPPKPSKKKGGAGPSTQSEVKSKPQISQLPPQLQRKSNLTKSVESIDKDCLIVDEEDPWQKDCTRKSLKNLTKLHDQTSQNPISRLGMGAAKKPGFMYTGADKPDISFLTSPKPVQRKLTTEGKDGFMTGRELLRRDTGKSSTSTDYGDIDESALEEVDLDKLMEPIPPPSCAPLAKMAPTSTPTPEEQPKIDEAQFDSVLQRLYAERAAELEAQAEKEKNKKQLFKHFSGHKDTMKQGRVEDFFPVGKRSPSGIATIKKAKKRVIMDLDDLDEEEKQDSTWSLFNSGPIPRGSQDQIQVDKAGRMFKKPRFESDGIPSSPPPPVPYESSTPPPPAPLVRKVSRIPTREDEGDDDELLPGGPFFDGMELEPVDDFDELWGDVDVRPCEEVFGGVANELKEVEEKNAGKGEEKKEGREKSLYEIEEVEEGIRDVMEFFGGCVVLVDD